MIPAEWRKTVDNLKEIVRCPEEEIYSILEECGMDPDEAAHKLIFQDTFHEVKTKRERRRQIKDRQESRFPGICSSSNHRARGGSDHNVECNRPIQTSSNGTGCSSSLSSQNRPAPLTNNVNVSKAVPLVAANLQLQNLQELAVSPTEECVVVIPDHLKFSSTDCPHLAFGTFSSGTGSAFSAPLASNPLKMGAYVATTVSSVEHLETRKSRSDDDDQLMSMSEAHIAAVKDENFHPILWESKEDDLGGSIRHLYAMPSIIPDYFSNKNQQPNSAQSYGQAKQQMTITSPFASGMVLKSGAFSVPCSTPQTLSGTSTVAVPELTQNHRVLSYSLPSGHGANMIGNPSLSQNHAYEISALQSAHQGSGSHHQLPVAVQRSSEKYNIPEYERSLSTGSLPRYAEITSGYGSFGQSFLQNSPTVHAGSSIGFDDILSSQLNDRIRCLAIHQNNSPAMMWVHGDGSTMMSAIPDSTYNRVQEQNHPHTEYRQSQQHLQQFGALENPNYHSQIGRIQEHQRQSSSFHHSQIGRTQEHQRQNPSFCNSQIGRTQEHQRQSPSVHHSQIGQTQEHQRQNPSFCNSQIGRTQEHQRQSPSFYYSHTGGTQEDQQHLQQIEALQHPDFYNSQIGRTQEDQLQHWDFYHSQIGRRQQRRSPNDRFFGVSQGFLSNQLDRI